MASILSLLKIVSKIISASSTFFANGPIWSKDEAWAIKPYLETAPYVGHNPTTPQRDAGCLIEPPVSDPNVKQASFAATAAAEPPELPPATLVLSCGFLVTPNAEFSCRIRRYSNIH